MRKQTGLTLIELLVTIAVLAVLAALAVPSFNDFIKNERIVAEANDIVATLYLARTEALKRNRRVTVCPSVDADAAQPSCTTTAAGNWSSGYIIFTDGNREAGADANGIFEPAAPNNEVLIKAKGPIVGNLRLDATAADIRGYISFLPRGQPKTLRTGPLTPSGDPSRSQSGALRLCDDRGDSQMRAITLSPTGRVRALAGSAAVAKTQTCPSI